MSESQTQSSSDPEMPQKIREYQKFIADFKRERENYTKLWKVFTDNVLTEDFKHSKWAALGLIFVPMFVNIYFIYRPHTILKNAIRVSSVIGCYFNLHHQLNQDFNALLKKDTVLANKARSYVQNIAENDIKIPDFGKETLTVYSNS